MMTDLILLISLEVVAIEPLLSQPETSSYTAVNLEVQRAWDYHGKQEWEAQSPRLTLID